MQRDQKIEINVFGMHIGWTSCQIRRITHNAQIAYLRLRLAQQNYEKGILTERIK